MADVAHESSAGLSALDRELYLHLTRHITAERDMLDEYATVAHATKSKALHYLVNLLIEDEIRHHRIFEELADSLKTDASLTGQEPRIPRMDFDCVDSEEVLVSTRQLLKNEESDIRELKSLHRQMRDFKDSTLWDLLVQLMQLDTQKHIAILRFVQAHTRRVRDQ